MNKLNPFWNEEKKQFPSLEEDIETDILVIGGGICGILTAYQLTKTGHNVCLVEENRIGGGITNKTTAFVSAIHDTMYHELIKEIGLNNAKLYLEANVMAIKEFERLSEIYDFDYEKVASCFFSECNDKIDKEINALKLLNYDYEIINEIPLPINIKKGLCFKNQGQMNASKLIVCLSQELTIYENTKIINIFKKKNYLLAKTNRNHIKAKKIVICTHFPIINNLRYSFKMYQRMSYVGVIKYDEELKATYTSVEEDGLYFRKYKDYLLIGGFDKRTGKSERCYKKLTEHIKKIFPNKEIEYGWVNQDLITIDNVAYIGRINLFQKDIYVATGFNEWGMTTSMISAKIITDLIDGTKNKFSSLFSPSRFMLKKTFFENMGEFIINQIGVKKKRCSHLGCVLHYNEEEDSFDCACHGSRFSSDGEVLNDPAKTKMKNGLF